MQCTIKNDNSKVVNLPLKLKMQWLTITASIQKCNEVMNHRCAELYGLVKADGYESCV